MFNNSTFFIGLDLGDKQSHLFVLDPEGELVEESRLPSTPTSFQRKFSSLPGCRVAMEVGAHSRWASQLLKELGHEVLVANARKLRAIYSNPRKGDRADAETLARLARLDPALLSAIHHRSPQAQADLAVLRSRDAVVRSRTLLINHVRSIVKSCGARLPSCSADSFADKVAAEIPEALRPAVEPILETIAGLTQQIRGYDRTIEGLCSERYPETKQLRGISGVGPLTALAFVLTLEDPSRFGKSREVGPALGLVPRTDQSGDRDPQLRITKTGDAFLRRLLVGSAQ
jgi:transposase